MSFRQSSLNDIPKEFLKNQSITNNKKDIEIKENHLKNELKLENVWLFLILVIIFDII